MCIIPRLAAYVLAGFRGHFLIVSLLFRGYCAELNVEQSAYTKYKSPTIVRIQSEFEQKPHCF
jgi:hypothetical protein